MKILTAIALLLVAASTAQAAPRHRTPPKVPDMVVCEKLGQVQALFAATQKGDGIKVYARMIGDANRVGKQPPCAVAQPKYREIVKTLETHYAVVYEGEYNIYDVAIVELKIKRRTHYALIERFVGKGFNL